MTSVKQALRASSPQCFLFDRLVESQLAALRMGPRPVYRGVTVILVAVLAYAILARLAA